MSRQSHLPALTLLAVLCASGCLGTDDGPNPFRLCGNGTIDRREQCDGIPFPTPSPNLGDSFDCLSTCQFNVCGDEFLNSQGPQNIEVCDGRVLGPQTCLSLGFQGGTLQCQSDCSGYDTSLCTPLPATPTATPTPTPTTTVTPASP